MAVDPIPHFAATYAEAREKFRSAACDRGLAVESHVHPVARGAQGEALAVDVAMLGAEKFCGSRCQVALLRDDAFVADARAASVRVVFLHALNPFGFSHLRVARRAARARRRRVGARVDRLSHRPGAALTGVNYNAVYDECPQVAYAGIALEYGTLPFHGVLQGLRGDQWLANQDGAPADVRASIKRGIRDAFYHDADDWKLAVHAQARREVRRALAGLAGTGESDD